MARRSGGSAAGYGLLLVAGGLIWLVNGIYEFVRQNLLFFVAAFAFAAAFGVLFLVIRAARRGNRRTTQAAAPIGPRDVVIPGAKASLPHTSGARSLARWIQPGETVQVQGEAIAAGLFYLGEAVSMPDGRPVEQYAINPKLPVGKPPGDMTGSSMPYWPSYASITPQARRAFLGWMAGGRRDPAYGIGHVFIFFYGLEHRMFVEGGGSAAATIVAEVRRLLSIYGGNGSFKQYATKFLECVELATRAPLPAPRLAPDMSGGSEIPVNIRLHLGMKLARTDRIAADDALLWMLSLPDFKLRTPAVRCFEMFVSLWRIRYVAAFPDGFRIHVPSANIIVKYRAASGAFEVEVPGPHSMYPDVATSQQSFDEFRLLADRCTSELDAFSRFVGKHPELRNSIQAALLLPDPIRHDPARQAVGDLGRRVRELMGARSTATAELRDLLEAGGFDIPTSSALPQSTADQLGQALDILDIAIEPDRRYGGGTARPEDQVVIFTAKGGGPIDPAKPSYVNMKVRVEVAALAAAVDGAGTEEEMQAIIGTIRSDAELPQLERLRLIAYAVTVFKSPPKRERIMRRLADTNESERKSIAAAAVAVVGQRDQADPREVKFLEKLHKALKLPAGQVYSDIHRAAVPADEPIPVSVEKRIPGIKIPKDRAAEAAAPRHPASGIRIDRKKLADVQRDTKAVSEILSRIFVDAPQVEEPNPVAAAAVPSAFNGLDAGHAELVKFLEKKGAVARPEFESRAKALRLLPAGAIERINDWSFDRFDEPLLEDGENIVLSPHLRGRLAELREMST